MNTFTSEAIRDFVIAVLIVCGIIMLTAAYQAIR
jgi:hypothetical protein